MINSYSYSYGYIKSLTQLKQKSISVLEWAGAWI